MAAAIDEAIEAAAVTRKDIAAIGVGSPGPLDPEEGIVVIAPNLGWKNVNVRASLEEEFRIPAFIENDVNVGTLGEHRLGAGQGVSDLVGIFVGTGIGGGIILDGRLYRGFNKTAGEIGHMVVVEGGPLCGCGNQGCLEAVASRSAITRMIREALGNGKKSVVTELTGKSSAQIKSQALAEALRREDKVVTNALQKATYYLGIAVAGVINFLGPEMIILGGGVVEAMEEFYLAEVRKTVVDFAFPNAAQGVRIVPARLADNAGVLGAAVMARMRLEQKELAVA
jgi:glucokinase